MDDVFTDPFGQVMRDVMIVASAAPGGAGNDILTEANDSVITEDSNNLVTEAA